MRLTGGWPEGGTYSGPGVVNGVFYPESTGVGLFFVTYSFTDGNGCRTAAQASLEITTCTSLQQGTASVPLVELYPNPSGGQFTLAYAGLTKAIHTLRVFNVEGRLVKAMELPVADLGKVTIDLTGLPTGVYHLQLAGNGKLVSRRNVVLY